MYHKTLSAIVVRIARIQLESITNLTENSGPPNVTETHRAAAPTRPKLFQLEINSFQRGISKWIEFCKQFESTVQNNVNLSETDKLHYRRYLGGEAASAIANLQTTEACYVDAIGLLKRRFGDIIRIEQDYLFKLPLTKMS